MNRRGLLGMLIGMPTLFVNRVKVGGTEEVPDDVADKITIVGDDGFEYQFKPESMKRRANAHEKHLNDHLGADTWDIGGKYDKGR